MEDRQIIDLYFARSEDAIRQTAQKYGKYCHTVAYQILRNETDSEECVSDTYFRAWSSMPPERPRILSAFLARITRNLSLDRLRRRSAKMRGGDDIELIGDELSECISGVSFEDAFIERHLLINTLNRFLIHLPKEQRIIFMLRYWYLCPVKDIAGNLNISESKVKMTLVRSRNRLRSLLEKEGVDL